MSESDANDKQSLLASEEMFRAFSSQTVEGIGVADVDGKYVYVNNAFCQMVGYSSAELLEMTVFDVKSAQQDHSSFAKSKSTNHGAPMLVSLQHKDGTDFIAEIVGKNIHFGGADYVLGLVRDVTQREKQLEDKRLLEQQMLHAEKLKSLGVLAGGIAHDFNNLLTTILGNAELAIQMLPPRSMMYQGISEIYDSAKRAAELSQQMLAYSGQGRFVLQSIDLEGLLVDTLQLLRSSISPQIEIRQSHESGAARFNGDVTQVQQVITSLLTNASEAIGDNDGAITLSTGSVQCSAAFLAETSAMNTGNEQRPPGEYVFVEVSDTGVGMDKATLDQLFDPFFTTKFTGRGLGMSATLGIVHGHNGSISIQSEPDRGSTFRVLFPTAKAASLPTPAVAPPDNTAWTGSGTILIADDEPGVLHVGTLLLKQIGFEVLAASDGGEAFALFKQHRQDIVCVLLDLTMKKMGGEEAFHKILQHSPDAKIILCSGYNEDEATARFRDKGLAGFVHKPYGLASLRSMFCKVLSS